MTTVIKVTKNGLGLVFSHRYLEANNWLLLLGLRPCIRGRPKAVHARRYSLSNSGDRLFAGRDECWPGRARHPRTGSLPS